jgi:arginase family enzyme
VILSDARDLDPQEEALVKDSRIVHLRDPRALLDYPLEKEALWVHFDCDVVNPVHSPAQHFPASGGPSTNVLKDIFEMLGKKGHIQAVSMSSWAPDLPGSDQSQQVTLDLLRTLYKNKER